MPGEIDAQLREEIVECQRTKSEFIRWKLILVAAVGAAALGVGSSDVVPVPVLFALIPVICIYVDAVCIHNDARIMMIAQFLRESSTVSAEAKAYERHCHRNRDRFYNEGLTLFLCSLFLSALVAGIGLHQSADTAAGSPWMANVLSGTAGAAITAILYFNSRRIQHDQPPFQLLGTPQQRHAPPPKQ
jgi:hypothetical protein